jgi:PAS domain S-box-containing protein
MGDVELFARAVHPDDRARVVAEVLRASGEIDRFDSEFRVLTPEGRVTWLHARASPVGTEDGQLRWLGVALDVTEQKVAEEALRAAEERYRAVVQNTYDLVVIADLDGSVVYASPSHRAVLGIEPGELVGRDALEFVGPADLEHSRASFDEALRGVRGSPVRYSMRRRDGQPVASKGPVAACLRRRRMVARARYPRDVTARCAERERRAARRSSRRRSRSAPVANDPRRPGPGMIAGLQIATIPHGVDDDMTRRRLDELARPSKRRCRGSAASCSSSGRPRSRAADDAVDEYLSARSVSIAPREHARPRAAAAGPGIARTGRRGA